MLLSVHGLPSLIFGPNTLEGSGGATLFQFSLLHKGGFCTYYHLYSFPHQWACLKVDLGSDVVEAKRG